MSAAFDRAAAHEKARLLSHDEWEQFTGTEAAKAIGEWLQARGRLDRPIHRLTLADLQAIADRAICRWIVLSSIRLQERPAACADALGWLLRD